MSQIWAEIVAVGYLGRCQTALCDSNIRKRSKLPEIFRKPQVNPTSYVCQHINTHHLSDKATHEKFIKGCEKFLGSPCESKHRSDKIKTAAADILVRRLF